VKTTNPKATKTVYPIICQIVNIIPHQFIAEAAKAHKVLSRTFTPKSHVAAMLYCQVSKTESLNSICDVAAANEALWTSMGVTVPRRNTFSNANAMRPSAMAKNGFDAYCLLRGWCAAADATGVPELAAMAKTIRSHIKGILGYWKLDGATNASMEGFNGKVRWLIKQAYGFRDFKYFRLKIFDLPSTDIRKRL
jgi:hypothetical protein